MKAKGEFTINKWDETPCGKPENKMTTSRASICYESSGNINGTFNVEYIMHYTNYDAANPHNASATYIGYITFSGSINGKSGSFVLEDNGVYSPTGPVSKLVIKSGTGTDALNGITGTGKYSAMDGKMIIELDYSLGAAK